MSTGTIGGTLSASALAKLHQPADLTAVDAEIRRLHRDGLKARDISQILKLNPAVIEAALTRGIP